MANMLARYTNKLGIWVACVAATLLLLAFFMYLQRHDSQFLDLDTKWLVIASIPLIVALLQSNVIQRFQGFGFELVTRLEGAVGRINVVATDALVSLPEDEKAPLDHLYALDLPKKEAIQRLTLVQGGTHYTTQAMSEYLENLPNLKFLEVQTKRGRFVALLSIDLFHEQVDGNQGTFEADSEELDRLLKAIKNRDVGYEFAPDALTDSVGDDVSLLTVLPKIRESKCDLLPVTSRRGQLLGIITTRIVEKRIANAVIDAQRNA